MDDARMRAFAEQTVRGSRRHVLLSVVVCGLVEAFEISVNAGARVYVGILAMLAFLLVYNALRMRLARRALTIGTTEALREFVRGQKRSHLVRGRVFLIIAPIIVIAGWASTLQDLRSAETPAIHVAAVVAATAFLSWGWLFWWRALRCISKWHA